MPNIKSSKKTVKTDKVKTVSNTSYTSRVKNGMKRLEKAVKENDKAKYYYKGNSGVSDTRNQGIKIAKGRYICFVDSDDIISENYLSDFINQLDVTKKEMICCKCKKIKNNDEIKHEIEDKIILKEYEEKNKYDLIFTEYAGYSVNKLYERDILINNSIFFNSEIGMCEDLLFVFEYLKYVDKVKCLSTTNYYYREVEQSASKNLKNLKWFSIFKAYNNINKDLNLCSPFFINRYYYMYNYYISFAKFRLKYIKKESEYNSIKEEIKLQAKRKRKNKYKNFTTIQKIKLFIFKNFNYIAFNIKLKREK